MIEGMDSLFRRIEKMENISLEQPLKKSLSVVQESAKSNCPVGDGELRESIFNGIQGYGNQVKGICYTQKVYAPFVEFGTGPKGQENHAGISPDIPVSYTQSPWWIHESQINKGTAEKYHWFSVDTPEGKFYQCTGQAAQPFMYQALKNNEKHIIEIFEEEIGRQIR